MANTQHHHDTLNSLFFNDLIEIYPSSGRAYRCTSISDLDFAKLGILRCISHAKTGQEFLQHHADQGEADIDPGHFFKSLNIQRDRQNAGWLDGICHFHDSMRKARWLAEWAGKLGKPVINHCISRVLDRRFVPGDDEREHLTRFARGVAAAL